jgi:plastocyanin
VDVYDFVQVKRTAVTLALCGTLTAVLAVPAAHAQESVSSAVLTADPSPATAGAVVRFSAPAGAASYAWDFDGDGVWDADGTKAQRDHRYLDAGAYSVNVRLTQPDGTEQVSKLVLDVGEAVVESDSNAAPDDTPDDEPAVGATATRDDTGGAPADAAPDTAPPAPRTSHRTIVAQTAATKTVTISDFEFTPATITVNAGDTVEWTNDGPTGHSATANDKSFDTGILAKGESGSQTFDTEGSFSYICTPHPFMKGTVKVVAAGTDTGSGSNDSGSSGSGATDSGTGDTSGTGTDTGSSDTTGTDTGSSGSGSGSGSDSSLPMTGTADLRIVGLVGFLLLLGGFGLRRLTRWV